MTNPEFIDWEQRMWDMYKTMLIHSKPTKPLDEYYNAAEEAIDCYRARYQNLYNNWKDYASNR